jgi:hypothetical protein
MSKLVDNLILVPPSDEYVMMDNGEKHIYQRDGYVCRYENGKLEIVTNLSQNEIYELVEYVKNLQKLKNML